MGLYITVLCPPVKSRFSLCYLSSCFWITERDSVTLYIITLPSAGNDEIMHIEDLYVTLHNCFVAISSILT